MMYISLIVHVHLELSRYVYWRQQFSVMQN